MNKEEQLVEEFLKNKTKKEMFDFLKGILTPKEFDEIATRLQIVKFLKGGIPHQTIAKNLAVGVGTVSRGSKELKIGRFKKV